MEFYSKDSVSLEKQVDLGSKPVQTKWEDIMDAYEIDRCVKWIMENKFGKVCLQFPDYLLPDSSAVVLQLQTILRQTVYVLGDSAYESCCIDYVSAAHINADAIIHFGPKCFSKTSGDIPYLNIYEKKELDLECLEKCCCALLSSIAGDVVVLIDTPYIHYTDKIMEIFENHSYVKVYRIDEDALQIENQIILFIGNNQRKLINLYLAFNPETWYYFEKKIIKYEQDQRILKRRYFLAEKIRDSKTVGIVVATVSVKNYRKLIERIKRLVGLSGKKYYTLTVGKPTVAKLANLGEIDLYVMISCAMSEIYESREFYKPIVTPYDLEVTLNPNSLNLNFCYDYNTFVTNSNIDDITLNVRKETDVSLLTGKIRSNVGEESDVADVDNQLVSKTDRTVALNTDFGAGFLAQRTWKGLEEHLGQNEVKLAEEGRSGIAQNYKSESLD